MMREISGLIYNATEEQVVRARNQLKASILFQQDGPGGMACTNILPLSCRLLASAKHCSLGEPAVDLKPQSADLAYRVCTWLTEFSLPPLTPTVQSIGSALLLCSTSPGQKQTPLSSHTC